MKKKRPIQAICTLVLCISTFLLKAQSISGGNSSIYEGNGKWQWTVYINASPDVLKTIEFVQYKLHPTFKPQTPGPVKSIGNPDKPFGLTRIGWGTFEVGITIKYKNGRTQTLKHDLKFEERKVAIPKRIEIRNVATKVERNWWKWTIFIKAAPEVLDQIKCVEYTLHESFPNPIQLVCNKGANSQQAFPYSASGWDTFTAKVKILFKDGTVQNMLIDLVF